MRLVDAEVSCWCVACEQDVKGCVELGIVTAWVEDKEVILVATVCGPCLLKAIILHEGGN